MRFLKNLSKRLKDVEICVHGVWTMAFWLGRKATETQSDKWTIYVRGATNDDLGVVIKRAVFQMHPSFNNSVRVVEASPFELSECGWGEFGIVISLFFHNDACEKQLDLRVLVHLSYVSHLKLYPEDESGPHSSKKPVVIETFDEIVFSEDFYGCVEKHPAVIVPRHPVTFNFPSGPSSYYQTKEAIEHCRYAATVMEACFWLVKNTGTPSWRIKSD